MHQNSYRASARLLTPAATITLRRGRMQKSGGDGANLGPTVHPALAANILAARTVWFGDGIRGKPGTVVANLDQVHVLGAERRDRQMAR